MVFDGFPNKSGGYLIEPSRRRNNTDQEESELVRVENEEGSSQADRQGTRVVFSSAGMAAGKSDSVGPRNGCMGVQEGATVENRVEAAGVADDPGGVSSGSQLRWLVRTKPLRTKGGQVDAQEIKGCGRGNETEACTPAKKSHFKQN